MSSQTRGTGSVAFLSSKNGYMGVLNRTRMDGCMNQSEVKCVPVTLTRSADLRSKLALVFRPRTTPYAPRELSDYIAHLHLLFDLVRASVPLMRIALAECTGDDLRSRKLASYFRAHITEEDGHDDLLLDDLEELGVSRSDARRRMPNPHIAAMVGAQYYWLAHVSPVPLLGYIAFLEGTPPTDADIAGVKPILPKHVDALRTLRVHAQADPFHSRMLDDLIDELDLDDADAALLGTSAMQTSWLMAEARAHAGAAR
jgi:pyrroloquinoline quinone (PQQ) biosynthesis protein C